MARLIGAAPPVKTAARVIIIQVIPILIIKTTTLSFR
jgi:hypothetical protein